MRNESETSQTTQSNGIRQEIEKIRESVELTRSDVRRTKTDVAQYQLEHRVPRPPHRGTMGDCDFSFAMIFGMGILLLVSLLLSATVAAVTAYFQLSPPRCRFRLVHARRNCLLFFLSIGLRRHLQSCARRPHRLGRCVDPGQLTSHP